MVESSECDDDTGVEAVVTFTVIKRFGDAVEFVTFVAVLLQVVVVVVAVGF